MQDNRRNELSRRGIVSAVGIGVAAAAAGPALAEGNTGAIRNGEAALQDPRSKYPKPPFKKQTQAWPGLARDMDPKPDHG